MNVGASLVGGQAGLVVWIVVAYVCHVAWPRRFTFNPLYFAGSVFTIETTPAYIAGLGVSTFVSVSYSLFLGALVYAFEVEDAAWLVGLIGGTALVLISGGTLAFSTVVHRGVRSGAIGAPGMFASEHGWTGVAALIVWHLVFGLVAGAGYGVLN